MAVIRKSEILIVFGLVNLLDVRAAPSRLQENAAGPSLFYLGTPGSYPRSEPILGTKQVSFDSQDPGPLFEGDIAGVVTEDDTLYSLKSKLGGISKSGALSSNRRWPEGRGYYEISSLFSPEERTILENAIREFERTDAFRWHPRDSQPDYVFIERGGSVCNSKIGKSGGKQYINLAQNCINFHTVVHELMHAVGFWHEQSRPDRDTYIEINPGNIQPGAEQNFLSYGSNQATTFNNPYDFGSIMHYERNAFAVNKNAWTTRPRPPYQNFQISPARNLSPYDIKDINSMYPLCAKVYSDGGYKGSSMHLIKNLQSNLSGSLRQQVTSVVVTFPCTLTLYSSANFGGATIQLKPASATVNRWDLTGTNWDNYALSVKCSC